MRSCGRRRRFLVHAPGATRKPLTHEVADVTADERATGLVSRCYVGRVVHGDRVLIRELRSAAEQRCRRRDDPAVARDSVDCFQQWSDTAELAPASNCHVRYLVTGKIERGERHVGIGEKRLGWSVKLVVGIKRREDHAGVQQQRGHAMALWLSPARQPHRHAVQPVAGACPWPPHDPYGACVARSRRTLAVLRYVMCRDDSPQHRPRSRDRPASTP